MGEHPIDAALHLNRVSIVYSYSDSNDVLKTKTKKHKAPTVLRIVLVLNVFPIDRESIVIPYILNEYDLEGVIALCTF